MRRPLVFLVGALVVLLVGAQLVLPGVLEGKVEERLTDRGGVARVSLDALPAARLFFGDGDRLEIRASGLDLEIARERRVFEKLDGFDEVDVRLTEMRAGPFEVDRLELRRPEDADRYRLELNASVSARELADQAASSIGGPLAGLAARMAARALPLASESIPVGINAELESRDGRPRVVSGGGSVAGIPTGPLAELVVAAVLSRL